MDNQDNTFTEDIRYTFKAPTDGAYFIRLINTDPTVVGPDVAYHLSVRRWQSKVPGALIIVAGRLKANDPQQDKIYRVANRVYRLFLRHGYDPQRLLYLAPDPTLDATGNGQPDVYTTTTRAHLKAVITQWAMDQHHVVPGGFLTLYFVDHGGPDVFYMDNLIGEVVKPGDLDTWLDALEAVRPDVRVNIFIEACHSGSFIDASTQRHRTEVMQSVSQEGRVVIASTAPLALAYGSSQGAAFSDAFIRALDLGMNLFQAYEEGKWATAHLGQVPWLNGDDDTIQLEPEDKKEARRRTLTRIDTRVWAPTVEDVQVSPGLYADERTFCARVQDDGAVETVWALIYEPSYQPPDPGSEEMVQETPRTAMLSHREEITYCARHPGFNEVGDYQVIVYARDKDDLHSRPYVLKVSVAARTITGVTIQGPVTGTINTAYPFTARPQPLTTTLPITYRWQATGQADVVHTGTLSHTVTFTWPNEGTQYITVTAMNPLNTVTNTHSIVLSAAAPPHYPTVYLPLVMKGTSQ